MITFEAVWIALLAADSLAKAHSLQVDARIDLKRCQLMIHLVKVTPSAGHKLVCAVGIPAADFDSCASFQQVTELVERVVAEMLACRPGRRVS